MWAVSSLVIPGMKALLLLIHLTSNLTSSTQGDVLQTISISSTTALIERAVTKARSATLLAAADLLVGDRPVGIDSNDAGPFPIVPCIAHRAPRQIVKDSLRVCGGKRRRRKRRR
jgi:hypothetical protein